MILVTIFGLALPLFPADQPLAAKTQVLFPKVTGTSRSGGPCAALRELYLRQASTIAQECLLGTKGDRLCAAQMPTSSLVCL